MGERHFLAAAAAGLALAVLAAGCGGGGTLTSGAVAKVKDGMTRAQVEAILGQGEKVGTLNPGAEHTATTAEVYAWGNDSFLQAARTDADLASAADAQGIAITFVDDQVAHREAVGL